MVVAQPESGLPTVHGQGGLPASWPGLQGVSVWSPYPRCPGRVRALEFGASFSSAAAEPSAVRCPEPRRRPPALSTVLSSEKGLFSLSSAVSPLQTDQCLPSKWMLNLLYRVEGALSEMCSYAVFNPFATVPARGGGHFRAGDEENR